jgi:hypothetical protein
MYNGNGSVSPEEAFAQGQEVGNRMSVVLCNLTEASLQEQGITKPSLDAWLETWHQVSRELGVHEINLSLSEGFPWLMDPEEFSKGVMTLWATSHFIKPQILGNVHAVDPLSFEERFSRAKAFLDRFESKGPSMPPSARPNLTLLQGGAQGESE